MSPCTVLLLTILICIDNNALKIAENVKDNLNEVQLDWNVFVGKLTKYKKNMQDALNKKDYDSLLEYGFEYKTYLESAKQLVEVENAHVALETTEWILEISAAMLKLQKTVPAVLRYLLWPQNFVYIKNPNTLEYLQIVKNLDKETRFFSQVVSGKTKNEYGVFSFQYAGYEKYFSIKSVKTGQNLYGKMYTTSKDNKDEWYNRLNSVFIADVIKSNASMFKVNIEGNELIGLNTFSDRAIYIGDSYINGEKSYGRKLLISNHVGRKGSCFHLELYQGPKILSNAPGKLEIRIKYANVNSTFTEEEEH